MNGNINVKALKHSLTISDYKEIFKSLDIPAFSENSSQIIYWSGDKNKNPLAGSPKLYYYKDNGVITSYTGGYSTDIIGLVQKRFAILNQPSSFLDAIQFILTTTGKSQETYQRVVNNTHIYNWEDKLGKFLRIKKGESALKIYDSKILTSLSGSCNQWVNEGISLETQEKYHIGYYERLNATTIPVFGNNGELYGIRCRHWREDEIAMGKYRPLQLLDGSMYKFNSSDILYGMNYNRFNIEETKTAWLTESEKAVMKLDTFYGNQSCALGMFGKNLGINRRNQILKLGVNKIIYIPDNDASDLSKVEYDNWIKDVQKFAEQFKGYCSVEIVYDNLGLLNPKDNATDADFDTWLKLYENREVIE